MGGQLRSLGLVKRLLALVASVTDESGPKFEAISVVPRVSISWPEANERRPIALGIAAALKQSGA